MSAARCVPAWAVSLPPNAQAANTLSGRGTEVCDQLVAAAKYIDKQLLGSTDDCGFSPFSIDMKPNHGTPDYARDVAFQKISNRVAGTKMAAERLGVH